MQTKIAVFSILQSVLVASDPAWVQANHEGNRLRKLGQYSAAEPYYRTALRESEDLEAGDLRRPTSAQNLAVICQALGEFPAAELLYKQAIAGWQKTPATIDAELGMANALTNLATLYLAEGRLAEAE